MHPGGGRWGVRSQDQSQRVHCDIIMRGRGGGAGPALLRISHKVHPALTRPAAVCSIPAEAAAGPGGESLQQPAAPGKLQQSRAGLWRKVRSDRTPGYFLTLPGPGCRPASCLYTRHHHTSTPGISTIIQCHRANAPVVSLY